MAGRPRKSCVWNYFEYEKETDKCVYQVKVIKDEEEEICMWKRAEWYIFIKHKKHLKIHHKEAYKKFEQEEGERMKNAFSEKKSQYPCFTDDNQKSSKAVKSLSSRFQETAGHYKEIGNICGSNKCSIFSS